MNKPLIGSIFLTIYHACVIMASYAGYIIITNIELFIMANILMPFLIVAYFIIYCILILVIVRFDYILYKQGWKGLYKETKEKTKKADS